MTTPTENRKPPHGRAQTLVLSLAVLALCEALLLIDVLADIFYIDISTSWINHTNVELLAVIGLGAALAVTGKSLMDLLAETRRIQTTVNAASGQFLQVIDAKFDDWALTASEREIALLLIKGLSVQEIADVRSTRPGTIKSQSNAVYRKAGVRGRNELAAYFVEDLLSGEDLVRASPHADQSLSQYNP
ncbi:MAG: helix-turn-helix transcriptional regulator [Alphaproteobacteria bacterium]|nr:helix-turn-helix transcriptional regulator [Alphaproteobacteria bacterium]